MHRAVGFLIVAFSLFLCGCGNGFSALSKSATSGSSTDLSLIFSSTAYTPFVLRPSIPNALVAEYETLTVSPYSAAQMTRVPLRNYDLFYDSRVSGMLNTAAQFKNNVQLVSFVECEFQNSLSQLDSFSNPLYQTIKGTAQSLCSHLRQPEVFFNTNRSFDQGPLSMITLQQVIETAVTPFLTRNQPFSFFDSATTYKIRSALLRIKYESMINEFISLDAQLRVALSVPMVPSTERQVLTALQSAANSQKQRIIVWNDSGKQAFQADQQRLAEAGRTRGALSYNNMPDDERKALTAYLYAVMWRYRGGGIVALGGTQAARFYFAQLPYSLLAILNGADTVTGAALGLSMFTNLALLPWGQFFDMGRTVGEESEIHDLIKMSTRGLFQTAGVGATLQNLGYDTSILRFYSLQFGICYLSAWTNLENILVEPVAKNGFNAYIDGAVGWGEYCAGSVFGLGLSETLLAGHSSP